MICIRLASKPNIIENKNIFISIDKLIDAGNNTMFMMFFKNQLILKITFHITAPQTPITLSYLFLHFPVSVDRLAINADTVAVRKLTIHRILLILRQVVMNIDFLTTRGMGVIPTAHDKLLIAVAQLLSALSTLRKAHLPFMQPANKRSKNKL